MIRPAPDDLDQIRAAVQSCIDRAASGPITRVQVLLSAASTQEEARRLAQDAPGLVVIAGSQTAGRGRLGRRWIDDQSQSLPATFVLDARAHDAGALSLAAGLAACLCAQRFLGPAHAGLRWPNDVVAEPRSPAPRKLAGVLVEREGHLALVGIGINVLQSRDDFPLDLRDSAASLAQFAPDTTRPAAAAALVESLAAALSLPPSHLLAQWQTRDALLGRHASFLYDGHTYTGLVDSIAPTSAIRLKTLTGVVELPALQTSLVHGSAH